VIPEAGDPTRSLRSTLRGIASVVAPASLVTALVFYFGWARTNVQADVMGLDDTLLGYSTQDYMLNSMSSMFEPLAVGVVGVLAGLASHSVLVSWAEKSSGDKEADRRRTRVLRAVTACLAATAVCLLVLGGLGSRESDPSRFVSLFAPVAITLGIVIAGYALHVGRRFLASGSPPPSTPERDSLRLVTSSLYIVLVFLSLFWTVSHYAGVKGVDLAVTVEQNLDLRPNVTLYSGRRLYLQPPVVETEIGQDSASYRFRYTGLKLLFRSGDNYFLRPATPAASDLNIVVPESPDLRLELDRRPPETGAG